MSQSFPADLFEHSRKCQFLVNHLWLKLLLGLHAVRTALIIMQSAKGIRL